MRRVVESEDGLVGAASTDQDVEVGSIVPVGPPHPVGMRGIEPLPVGGGQWLSPPRVLVTDTSSRASSVTLVVVLPGDRRPVWAYRSPFGGRAIEDRDTRGLYPCDVGLFCNKC